MDMRQPSSHPQDVTQGWRSDVTDVIPDIGPFSQSEGRFTVCALASARRSQEQVDVQIDLWISWGR